MEAKIFLKDTVITRSCTFRQKSETHFDIYELNFGMNKTEVKQREFTRFANPDLMMSVQPNTPTEFSIPNYGRFLNNQVDWRVINIYKFSEKEKLIAVSEYIPAKLWNQTNIIKQCKVRGLKEAPVIVNNKLDKEYTWINGKIKYTLNQRLSEYDSNSLMGVTFEKVE